MTLPHGRKRLKTMSWLMRQFLRLPMTSNKTQLLGTLRFEFIK